MSESKAPDPDPRDSVDRALSIVFRRREGEALRPPPPVESKHEGVRYSHIREGEPVDETLLAKWSRQASRQPGDDLF